MDSSQLTLSQRHAVERRQRMNQRRHELSNRIRKQRKSELLARKRNMAGTVPIANAAIPGNGIEQCNQAILTYLDPNTPSNLRDVDESLSRTVPVDSPNNPLIVLNQEQVKIALTLIENLRNCLEHGSPEARALALAVLLRLSAFPTNSSKSNEQYYGNQPSSWSLLMVRDVLLIALLVAFTKDPKFARIATTTLGNLAGEDSDEVRKTLQDAKAAEAMIENLKQNIPLEEATWALNNIIRQDSTSMASTYCSSTLLTPQLLESLLRNDQMGTSSDMTVRSNCTAWVIAALTQRESLVVDFLCSYDRFCLTIVERLEHCLFGSGAAPDVAIPLVQSLGHIASTGQHVPHLLNETPIITTLSRYIESVYHTHLESRTRDESSLFTQTCWLIGCFLCDARTPNHPSTEKAAPTFLPRLLALLDRNGRLSREEISAVMFAVWNALEDPPPLWGAVETIQSMLTVTSVLELCWDQILGSCNVLVEWMEAIYATEPDAIWAGLSFFESALMGAPTDERLSHLKGTLERIGFHDRVLEQVCNNINLPEQTTEIAARLIDEFFDNDEEEADDLILSAPVTSDQHYGFGLNTADTNSTFDFGTPPMPAGRGRGRVQPAWMQNQRM